MGTHGSAVKHDLFQITVTTDGLKQAFPDPALGPSCEARERGMPVPQFVRQITPRRTRASDPQHGFQKQPVVLRGYATIRCLARQQLLDPFPLVISQNLSIHCSNAFNQLGNSLNMIVNTA